jgi:hypothetical protein
MLVGLSAFLWPMPRMLASWVILDYHQRPIYPNNAAKLVPFAVIVEFQAFLAICAFILSLGRSSNLVKQKTTSVIKLLSSLV